MAGFICFACSDRDGDEPVADTLPISKLAVKVGSAYYHAVIDQTTRRIEIGVITQPNSTEFISEVVCTMVDGATVEPDMKTFVGRWQPEQTVTVTLADGTRIAYTIVFAHIPAGNILPARKWISPWYWYAPLWDDIEPHKDLIHVINHGGAIADKEFIDACHTEGIEVYHTGGGGNFTNWSADLLFDPARITTYVTDFVDGIISSGYDGVNLDIEGLTAGYKTGFSSLVTQLGEQLHSAGKGFSICLPSWGNPGGYDPATINAACDFIYFMNYDLYYAGNPHTGTRGPTTPYDWTLNIMKSGWLASYDKQKTIIGLPAYSNYYQTWIATGVTQGVQMAPSYKPEGVTPVWLDDWRCNAYTWSGNGFNFYLFATDARSTRELLNLMDEFGYRELGFFRYRLISDEMWDEIEAWAKR